MIDLSLIKAPEGYPIQDPDTKDIYIFNGEDWVLYWHGYELKNVLRKKWKGSAMLANDRLTPNQKFFMERRDKVKNAIKKVKNLDMDMETKTIVLDALNRELWKCCKHI